MPRSELDRYDVYRGESLDFQFLTYENDPSGWTCQIDVKANKAGSSLITPRTISYYGNGLFKGFLTATETDLAPGQYFLIAKFTNTDQERQEALRFHVKQAWA